MTQSRATSENVPWRQKQRFATVIAAVVGSIFSPIKDIFFGGGELVHLFSFAPRFASFELVGSMLRGAAGGALLVGTCIGIYNLLSPKSTWPDRGRTLRNGAAAALCIALYAYSSGLL